MLLVICKILEILGITQAIDFFWTPEEAKLLICQLVELLVLQRIITLDADTSVRIKER